MVVCNLFVGAFSPSIASPLLTLLFLMRIRKNMKNLLRKFTKVYASREGYKAKNEKVKNAMNWVYTLIIL